MRPEAESRTASAVGTVGCRERACVWVAMGASGGTGESCEGGVSMSQALGSNWRSSTTTGVGATARVGATPGGGSPAGASTCDVVRYGREVMYWQTMHWSA